MKNVHPIDRFARLILGVLLLEGAYFWLAGASQYSAYVVAAVMLITSGLGFCPLYKALGISRVAKSTQSMGKGWLLAAWVVLLAVIGGGSYGSALFTRKLFLEDFNVMNQFYKQTLFLASKGEREKAVGNYEYLLSAYRLFQDKYTSYKPLALRGDQNFSADLAKIDQIFIAVNELVRTGDLHQAHLDLEKVRPVFQELFKRNGFSLLAVALVDFHDAMELLLDAANAKNTERTIALYPQVSGKLQAVEAEANDEEIQAIRKNLDAVLASAKESQKDVLLSQSEQLKSSFIKVYLKRG